MSTYMCSSQHKFIMILWYKQCFNISYCCNKYSLYYTTPGTNSIIFLPFELIFQNTSFIWNLILDSNFYSMTNTVRTDKYPGRLDGSNSRVLMWFITHWFGKLWIKITMGIKIGKYILFKFNFTKQGFYIL